MMIPSLKPFYWSVKSLEQKPKFLTLESLQDALSSISNLICFPSYLP